MQTLHPEIKPYARHELAVEAPHVLYVDESGSPDGLPVLFDSGIRSGTDIVKALALGATAVGVGRRFRTALAPNGQHPGLWRTGILLLRCCSIELCSPPPRAPNAPTPPDGNTSAATDSPSCWLSRTVEW